MSPKTSEDKKEGFFQKVYELVKQVPEGHVVTYGQVAAALGNARKPGL